MVILNIYLYLVEVDWKKIKPHRIRKMGSLRSEAEIWHHVKDHNKIRKKRERELIMFEL